MRFALLAILVFAAACGGEVTQTIDAPGTQPIDAPAALDDGPVADARPVDAADPDAADDAAVDAPIDGPPIGGCGGALVGGSCWYKSMLSQSCNGTCATHGGPTDATAVYAGATAAGSRANQAHCQAVAVALSNLAFSAAVTTFGGSNDHGCAEEPAMNRTELISGAITTNTGASPLLRRFCACNQ